MISRFKNYRALFLIWSVLLSSLFGSPSREDIDIIHYSVAINLNDSSDAIEGKTMIKFRREPNISELKLDFTSNFSIHQIRLNNKTAKFKRTDNRLEIALESRENPASNQLLISYAGEPTDGLIIKNNKFGKRTFFVDNWPNRAHNWFPCVDHPSDKASVEMHINAPEKYQVVANGPLVSQTKVANGYRTWNFASRQPLPTYCVVFGAAAFSIVRPDSGITPPLSYWFFPADSLSAIQNFSSAPAMLTYYEQRFGKFPFEKLALVQANTRFGGMENAGAIFFNEKSFARNRSFLVTVAHEIVHQWFGDWLTPARWNNLWLSEGFASYFGMQYFEHVDKSRFIQMLEKSRSRYLQQKKWHNRALTEKEPANLFELLNANNYTKGQWALHMLRNEIGDSLFWQSIRTATNEFAGANWTTSDFQDVCEKITNRKLEWFFNQWIKNGGIPQIEVNYFQDSGMNLHVQVGQKQTTPVMRLKLKISVQQNDIWQDRWFECRDQIEQFNWPLKKKSFKIKVDRHAQILAGIKLREQKFTSKNK